MTVRAPVRVGVDLMGMDDIDGNGFAGLLRAAEVLDTLGVDLVVLPDHLGLNPDEHAHRAGFPYPLDVNWYEPVVALSAIAARTRNVRLGMNVLVAPLRPALVLAKQLATLDAVSGGRVEAALGVGWQQAEFASVGVEMNGRFGLMVDQVRACRVLWGDAPAPFVSGRVDLAELVSRPRPVQGDVLPVSLGLRLTDRNLARIVDLGAGWAPVPMAAPDLAADVARLRAGFAQVGRDPDSVRVTASVALHPQHTNARVDGWPHPLAEAKALWDAGADTVVVHPVAFCEALADLPGFIEPLLAARDRRRAPGGR